MDFPAEFPAKFVMHLKTTIVSVLVYLDVVSGGTYKHNDCIVSSNIIDECDLLNSSLNFLFWGSREVSSRTISLPSRVLVAEKGQDHFKK